MSGYSKLENDPPPAYGDRPQFTQPSDVAYPTNPPPNNPYSTQQSGYVPPTNDLYGSRPSVSQHPPPPPPPAQSSGSPRPYGTQYGTSSQYGTGAGAGRPSVSTSRVSQTGAIPSYGAPESYTDTFEYKEATRIMHEGFFECVEEPVACVISTCLPCIMAGMIYDNSGQGNFFIGCCCAPLLCGLSRSHTQQLVGAYDPGCFYNCAVRYCCGCCSLTQEYRAIENWSRAKQNFTALQM